MFVLLISVELLTNFLLIKITQPFCSKTKLCLDLFYGCKHLSNLNETIKNTYMYFQIPCFFPSLSLYFAVLKLKTALQILSHVYAFCRHYNVNIRTCISLRSLCLSQSKDAF